MHAKAQRWGNSLAARIPMTFAEAVGLQEESPIEISARARELVITSNPLPSLNLEALLEGITDENLHGEIETGPAVGNEVR